MERYDWQQNGAPRPLDLVIATRIPVAIDADDDDDAGRAKTRLRAEHARRATPFVASDPDRWRSLTTAVDRAGCA